MKPNLQKKKILNNAFHRLYRFFGPQHWWPGHSRLEIMVGAILTQNTNWTNVEKAILNLKRAKKLSISALDEMPASQLAQLIRPAGYFNVKAKRLKNFVTFLWERYNGDLRRMSQTPLPQLREELLGVNGVGPETADSILLYAFDKPAFVIDAYTKRILTRHKLVPSDATYHDMQDLLVRSLKEDASLFNEYHALIVHTGKHFCRTKPLCEECPLNRKELYL